MARHWQMGPSIRAKSKSEYKRKKGSSSSSVCCLFVRRANRTGAINFSLKVEQRRDVAAKRRMTILHRFRFPVLGKKRKRVRVVVLG